MVVARGLTPLQDKRLRQKMGNADTGDTERGVFLALAIACGVQTRANRGQGPERERFMTGDATGYSQCSLLTTGLGMTAATGRAW